MSKLDRSLQERLERELGPGELLIWTDQPQPAVMARRALPVFFMAIPWQAFCVFWLWSASGRKLFDADYYLHPSPGMLFPAFGLIHFSIGLFMLSAPWRAYRGAGRIAYALTDRRALSLEPRLWGALEIRTWELATLDHPILHEDSSGSGDLIFEEIESKSGRHRKTIRRGFLGLGRVDEAWDELWRAKAALPSRP